MDCVCGNIVEVNSTCGDCGRIHENCIACGGQVIAMPKTMVLACPYCDTPLHKLDADETPYFPINFTAKEIKRQLNHFLLNRFGIPDDFVDKQRVIQSSLSFVPIRLYTVQAFLNETIFEMDTKAIILNPSLWYLSQIKDYRFAVRVKQVMHADNIESKVYPIEMSDEEATQMAQRFGDKLLERDRARFQEVPSNPQIIAEVDGDVFYPLYEVTYEYRNHSYRAVLDASNGVVCFAEHPMCSRTRAAVATTGVMMLVATLVLTVVFANVGVSSILAPLMVFCIGVAASGNIVWTAMRSQSGQEFCVPESPVWLELLYTYGELPIKNRKNLSKNHEAEGTP